MQHWICSCNGWGTRPICQDAFWKWYFKYLHNTFVRKFHRSSLFKAIVDALLNFLKIQPQRTSPMTLLLSWAVTAEAVLIHSRPSFVCYTQGNGDTKVDQGPDRGWFLSSAVLPYLRIILRENPCPVPQSKMGSPRLESKFFPMYKFIECFVTLFTVWKSCSRQASKREGSP